VFGGLPRPIVCAADARPPARSSRSGDARDRRFGGRRDEIAPAPAAGPERRAPYGAVGPGLFRTATGLGFKTIQWDIDPRDWSRPGAGAIYSNVVDNAHPGAIVIQHDGGGDRSQTLAALAPEIETLRARAMGS